MSDGRWISTCWLMGLLVVVLSKQPAEGATPVEPSVRITKPNGQSKDVSLGKSVTIECTVTCDPDSFISVGWQFMARDSLTPVNVNNTGAFGITVVSSSRTTRVSTLTLQGVTYWRDGFYYCHLVTYQRELTAYVEVNVKGAPYIERSLSTKSGTINTIIDESLEIECYVKARPEAQIRWFKDGRQLSPSSLHYTITTMDPILSIDSGSTLSLFPVSRADLGAYECRANNSLGNDEIKWDVKAPPALSVTRPKTNNTDVIYGYQLVVECEGVNFGTTRQIKWFFQMGTERIELKGSTTGRYQIYPFRTSSETLSSELVIDAADFDDQGWYWCTSETFSANARINVIGRPVVTTSTTKLTTLPGATVTLTCDIRARPKPFVIGWFKNNQMLGNTSKYEVSSHVNDPDAHTYLTIHYIEVSDYGNSYRCKAENTKGKGESVVVIEDVNECLTGANDCQPALHEICVDTLGAYECHCVGGYEKKQGTCSDINECQEQPRKCSQTCVNTPGSFRCECQDGYRLQSDMVTCIADQGNTGPDSTPPSSAANMGDAGDSVAVGVGVGIGLLLLIIIIIVVIVLCRRKRNKAGELLDVPKTNPPTAGRGFYNTAYSVEGEEAHIYTELSPTGDEFPRGRLRFLNSLGEGKFGRVVMAEALSISRTGKWEEVAVKMIKETATDALKEDFFHELLIVRKIPAHQNVVAYLGCVTASEPALIIMEYVNGGDLLTYLRKRRPENTKASPTHGGDLTPKDLLSFALQISRGLAHIAEQKIIHRDVAARNVLIDRKHVCKVSDFGLARDVEGADIYERTNKGPLPIRWMAPECLRDSVHTTKSDVWAYGVLLWEIVTLGASPYPGMSGQMVMGAVLEGKRLQCPPQCNQEMYNMMSRCWEAAQSSRPSFPEMSRDFEKMLEEEGDYIQLDHIEEGIYQVLEGVRSEERI